MSDPTRGPCWRRWYLSPHPQPFGRRVGGRRRIRLESSRARRDRTRVVFASWFCVIEGKQIARVGIGIGMRGDYGLGCAPDMSPDGSNSFAECYHITADVGTRVSALTSAKQPSSRRTRRNTVGSWRRADEASQGGRRSAARVLRQQRVRAGGAACTRVCVCVYVCVCSMPCVRLCHVDAHVCVRARVCM